MYLGPEEEQSIRVEDAPSAVRGERRIEDGGGWYGQAEVGR